MKKAIAVLALAAFVSGSAFAAEQGSPEYKKMAEYKRAQREKKSREKANPSSSAKGFWAREAERSGFAGTGAMLSPGNWFHGGTADMKKEK